MRLVIVFYLLLAAGSLVSLFAELFKWWREKSNG